MIPRLGVPELLIILVIVIAIFGVGKLPQLGGAIGRAIREFREATSTEAGDESSSTAKEKS